MPAKKRSTPQRKRPRAPTERGLNDTFHHPPSPKNGSSLRKIQKTRRASPSAYRQLLFGGSVLIMAIIASIGYNYFTDSVPDPVMRQFWSRICRVAHCTAAIHPTGRTLQANRPVRAGEALIEIPRSVQLWDLDALRSEFVRNNNLLHARHDQTNNPLSTAAYLAVYLAYLHKQSSKGTWGNTSISFGGNTYYSMDQIHQTYLKLLPNVEQFKDHPLLWDEHDVIELLNYHSFNFRVFTAFQDMIVSEFQAFNRANPNLIGENGINFQEYKVARLQVLTRSFSPGYVGAQDLDDKERLFYRERLGVDFTRGCHAMVPILDMLNHHPNPNVVYSYDQKKQQFVVSARKALKPDFELHDSYGKFSDSHLFARYGFVNGDGSGYTQASIALFHKMLNFSLEEEFSYLPRHGSGSTEALQAIRNMQRKELKRYLQYDDGYAHCIPDKDQADPDEWELKQLKLEHLVNIANDAHRWVIQVSPRNPHGQPARTSKTVISKIPPSFDMRNLRMNMSPLVETCRLISLVNSDYNGEAIRVLRDHLGDPNFRVEEGNNALEYRALACLGRLASTTLLQYNGRRVKDEVDLVSSLNRNAFGSRNWTTAHLRLGEMQTLQVISAAAIGQTRKWEEELPEPIPVEYTLREWPCPKEFMSSDALSNQN